MTESAACSRLIQRGVAMSESSFYREKAEQALRLARDSTDPVLIKSLADLAQEYIARADMLDGVALGKDPEDDE